MSEYLVYYVFLINFNSNHGCRQYEPRNEKSENVAVCHETTRTSMNMSESRGGTGVRTPWKITIENRFPLKFWYGFSSRSNCTQGGSRGGTPENNQ